MRVALVALLVAASSLAAAPRPATFASRTSVESTGSGRALVQVPRTVHLTGLTTTGSGGGPSVLLVHPVKRAFGVSSFAVVRYSDGAHTLIAPRGGQLVGGTYEVVTMGAPATFALVFSGATSGTARVPVPRAAVGTAARAVPDAVALAGSTDRAHSEGSTAGSPDGVYLHVARVPAYAQNGGVNARHVSTCRYAGPAPLALPYRACRGQMQSRAAEPDNGVTFGASTIRIAELAIVPSRTFSAGLTYDGVGVSLGWPHDHVTFGLDLDLG